MKAICIKNTDVLFKDEIYEVIPEDDGLYVYVRGSFRFTEMQSMKYPKVLADEDFEIFKI